MYIHPHPNEKHLPRKTPLCSLEFLLSFTAWNMLILTHYTPVFKLYLVWCFTKHSFTSSYHCLLLEDFISFCFAEAWEKKMCDLGCFCCIWLLGFFLLYLSNSDDKLLVQVCFAIVPVCEEPMKIFFLLCENGITNAEFLQSKILT